MAVRPDYSIQINGKLYDLSKPHVMGILNVTPDSFYAQSRAQEECHIIERVQQILDEGGDFIDLGAYSSRPDASDISVQEEMNRLRSALKIIRREFPQAVVSVDTFRAEVAACCVEEFGVGMINDISGGAADANMFDTVAQLGVPYVLMHMRGTPQTMQGLTDYHDLIPEITLFLAQQIDRLREKGAKDLIIDPGFGFSKTMEQNYQLLQHMDALHALELPILVGVSRKSMIYRLLGTTPEEALNGTTVLNTIALQKGASILRVHDVKACRETITLLNKLSEQP